MTVSFPVYIMFLVYIVYTFVLLFPQASDVGKAHSLVPDKELKNGVRYIQIILFTHCDATRELKRKQGNGEKV
jgi:glycopeptide antibiotics resistance protein